MSVPQGKDCPLEDLRAWISERNNLLACLPYDQIYYRCGWCVEEAALPFKHRFEGYDRAYCSEGCRDADVTLVEWQQEEAAQRKAIAERLRSGVV